MITLVSFIGVLLVVVLVHEFGHLFTARWFGVKALEFGVGYPPRIFKVYTGKTQIALSASTIYSMETPIHEGQIIHIRSIWINNKLNASHLTDDPVNLHDDQNTSVLIHHGKIVSISEQELIVADMMYSINLFPLGGFVRLSGETDASLPMSLASKPPWQRAIILISGALMNLIYPILVFTILSMVPHNVPIENSGQIQIVEVIPGSPADQGGVAAQDKILFVNEAPISSPSSLKDVLNLNQDQSSKWTIERSQKRIDLEGIPQYDNSYEQWVSGIRITTVNQQYTRKSNPPWVAVYDGFAETIKLLNALQYEVRNMVTQDVQNQITGPVGIAQITGEVAKQAGFQGVVILSIIISINLAILNILPIPMLDGGRLLFVMIEMVRGGKQLSRQRENFFHAMGFVFLITLIIIVTMKDIQKILLGESFLGG